MELFNGHGCRARFLDLEETWPLDARMALFLLESEGAAMRGELAGRTLDRFACRVRARLVRVCDGRPQSIEIFIRDLSAAHVGFVCDRPLENGVEYQIHFTPADSAIQVPGFVGRCREFTRGWHEGVLHLHQSQAAEAPLRLAV